MKKLLSILLIVSSIAICGCKEFGPDYHYTYKVKVTYQNGDIDTVKCGLDSFNGNSVGLYVKTSDNGVLVNAGTPACLTLGCGFYQYTVVCGVRKYILLESDTLKITHQRKDNLNFEVQ